MTIRVIHVADIHVCEKHMHWVDIALTAMVEKAKTEAIDVWVIAGDSFDSAIQVHSPAYAMFVKHVMELSQIAPGVILYGTPSHDRPGVLEPFKHLPFGFPVWIADKPEQALLQAGEWYAGGEITDNTITEGDAVFSFLPSLNKGDPKVMEVGAGKYAADILAGFMNNNLMANAAGISTVLVTHGTVVGSVTESGYALVTPDHEFTEETLYSAGAEAVMLGHIHKQQSWMNGRQIIAYPGSLSRLVHGDHDKHGFLIWQVQGEFPGYDVVEVPTRKLLEATFSGPPDMDELKTLAAEADENTKVRIRWSVDYEHAHTIDKQAILALFDRAEGCKLEATVNPIQRVRAEGIGRAASMEDKIALFAESTGDTENLGEISTRLAMLQSMDVDEIVRGIIQ